MSYAKSDPVLSADQLAPHNIGAEEAVLGSVLVNPEALFEVLPFLKSEYFFIMRHAWIWEAMLRLNERRDPIDYLTVVSELEQVSKLAEVGGAAYILSLINKTPSALNIEGYGRIVERMAIRRFLIDAAQQVARAAHSDETDIDQVIAQAESAVADVTITFAQNQQSQSWEVGTAIADNVCQAHEWAADPNPVRGTPCGLALLDHFSRGWMPEELIYIAGRPGHGKSTLMFQIMTGLSRSGAGTILFSFEMSKQAALRRMGCQLARVDGDKLKEGTLSREELERYQEAELSIERLGIKIVACGGLTVAKMVNIASACRMQHGLDFAFVDTINRVSEEGSDLRHSMTKASHGLADWAHNRRIGIFAAAQLNRQGIGVPDLEDLAEAGALEQDADGVYAVYQRYVQSKDEADKGQATIWQLKNRDGVLVNQGMPMYFAPWPGFETLESTRDENASGNGQRPQRTKKPYIMGIDND